MIVYEFPLNERVRTWLRLEDLYDKALSFAQSAGPRAHHAALLALFEIADATVRSELRNELMQELERQRSSLEGLRQNPAVDTRRLDAVLGGITEVSAELLALSGKIGQHIRDNEWLAGVRGRAGIPGGTCSFDLPAYHYWLNQPDAPRQQDLQRWLAPMLPIRRGVLLVLKILREGGHTSSHVAEHGGFQLMLGGRTAHMLRVATASSCAPEVSANKYAVNIRFLVPDTELKPRTCDQDIDFDLTFCNL